MDTVDVSLAIVSGGKGTRLQAEFEDTPKSLVPVAGKPVLQYQLEVAARSHIRKAYVLTGHLSAQVEAYVRRHRPVGALEVECVREPEPLGTAGVFHLLESHLRDSTNRLIVMYGDLICNMDLRRLIQFHDAHDGIASLTAHPNDHPFDSDLFDVRSDGRVTHVHKKPHPEGAWLGNLVNAAVYVIDRKVLDYVPRVKSDWMHDVFTDHFLRRQKVYAYRTSEFIKDMGTAARLEETEKSVRSGRYDAWTYEHKRPCIFIDRDGTINRHVELCHTLDEFELLEGAAQAIAMINRSEYLAIVITNQPVVARGLCNLDELRQIHLKMETLLGREGAYVDGLYFCPHHPHSGYAEEVPEYKVRCQCRKPGTQMFLRAQKDFNIDLARSVVVGDSTTDVQAGTNAGLTTALVKTGRGGRDGQFQVRPDYVYSDLLAAVNELLGKESSRS